MKRLLTACLLACALSGAVNSAVIWEEDFNSYSDGITNGASGKWTVDISACTLDGDDHFEIRSQHMQGNDLDGEAVWLSESIPITGLTDVSISVDLFDNAGGLESADYIKIYYKLDGGAETLFETNGDNSDDFPPLTASQTNLIGNTLEIVVRMMNNATTEFISFDNIQVTDASNATPELSPIGNQTVFVSDSLTMVIIGTDTDNDSVTLSASGLPPGAVFNSVTGTGTAIGLLTWSNASPAGVYTSTFYAADGSTNHSETIVITAEHQSEIDGYFYGWDPETIVKLKNGQFWRNTGGVGSDTDPRLRNPDVTITNWLQRDIWRLSIAGGDQNQQVSRMDITETTLISSFTGLHNGNTYELFDGTIWEQLSFENISSFADPVTVWRWTENSKTYLCFRDSEDRDLGTCQAVASELPDSGAVITEVDGWFRGWKNDRVFALANGEFWQQTVSDSSADTLYRPEVILTNYLGTGTWRLYVDEATAPGYVEVQQLTNVTRTTIDGTFYGFGIKEFFHLQNGDWWRQTSFETSASTRSNPDILIWEEDGAFQFEMPDEGRTVTAKKLTVVAESSVTNAFSGLHYGTIYQLANGDSWIQISFENINSSAVGPDAMLWVDGNNTNLLLRGSSDEEIGDCEVVDPNADPDGDQIANAAEIIAGTDLADAKAFFQITETVIGGNGHHTLNWPAVEDRRYAILWTASLDQIFQPQATVDAPTSSWTDTEHTTDTNGFYKIEVSLIP